MKFSNCFIPTTKEVPKDAQLPSHIYLMKAGFIAQVSAGIYNILPLGKMVLENISTIVRDELNKAGNQEVQLGFVTPTALWEESGRFAKYGAELLRIHDRKNNDFVLSPTAEEMMVNLVKGRVKSYKNLPLNLYQINLKFRDEARARFGLLRGREFIMKDGYSFHANEEDMVREFELMEATYSQIFARLGLDFRVVEADSGAIGGEGSKEFMVLANSGEDTIVVCDGCGYSANIETAKRAEITKEESPIADFAKFQTPDIKTMEALSDFFKVEPYFMIKAVAKRAIFDEGSEIVLFFLRGSDELQEQKALSTLDANELVDVSEEELSAAGLVAGFMGPVHLDGVRKVVDESLFSADNMICGANEKDYHFVGFSMQNMNKSDIEFADIAEVQEGDTCAHCGGRLSFTKGIEVGHIFQLKEKYSKPMKAEFLDENGKAQPFVMGTYGIGISRLIASIIEQHHDEKGMIWPLSVAPFSVQIIVSDIKKEEQLSFATTLYESLQAQGVSVLLDDRKERFGFKMKDFELVGVPYGIVVGKGLSEGSVELIERATLQKEQIASNTVVDTLLARLG